MSPSRPAPTDSTRQSSDWTASETDDGDGEQTDLTSCSAMEPEQEDMFEDSDGDDDGEDARSTYAPSYYPNMKFYDAPIDMGFDGADNAASTRSICVPDLGYQELFGRRYCKNYFMPNDEHELARQTLLHQVHLHAFDGELTTTPLCEPTKILDIGTGTGEWPIRIGEMFPDCEVIGTDISAVQETSVPPNVFFEIDDAEVPWERLPESFDLVHFRHTSGAFRDPSFVYRQAFDTLKPGGWIELKEVDRSNGGDRGAGPQPSFLVGSADSASSRLAALGFGASRRAGRVWGPANLDPRMLMDVGFVDVRIAEHVFAFGTDAARGNVAQMFLIATLEGLEAMFLRLLVEQLNMDPEDVKDLCEQAAVEMVDATKDAVASKHLSFKLLVLTGRKPHPHEVKVDGGGGGESAGADVVGSGSGSGSASAGASMMNASGQNGEGENDLDSESLATATAVTEVSRHTDRIIDAGLDEPDIPPDEGINCDDDDEDDEDEDEDDYRGDKDARRDGLGSSDRPRTLRGETSGGMPAENMRRG